MRRRHYILAAAAEGILWARAPPWSQPSWSLTAGHWHDTSKSRKITRKPLRCLAEVWDRIMRKTVEQVRGVRVTPRH